jgi:hypothetical protein
MMETINIEVSSQVAEAYRNFAVNQRQQIEGLINGLLSQLIQERSLDEIIDDMPHQADAIGLSVTDLIITKLGNSDIAQNQQNFDQDSPESQSWEVFALNNLNKCYSEDELIYDLTRIKENNLDYKLR